MEKRIIDKYAELNEACKKYSAIELSSVEERAKRRTYQKPKQYAKDGFIEKFCLY